MLIKKKILPDMCEKESELFLAIGGDMTVVGT